jgi:ubiquitin C-terminal hydrolase
MDTFGGLQNNGLTCALNSLIQLLTHTPVLHASIIHAYRHNTVARNSVTWQLGDVIDLIYYKKQTISPMGFLKEMCGRFKDVHIHEQQDICELWMLLSSHIAEELNVQMDPVTSPENKIDTFLRKMYNNKNSEWQNTITSIHLSIVECQNCKDRPWNPEIHTTLQVDIPYGGSSDSINYKLEELLLGNFKMEYIDDWLCDKCSTRGTAHKCNQIYSFPSALIIVLKRFQMDGSGTFIKTHNPIQIPKVLSFEVRSRKFIYEIKCIANHYGAYHGGHYNACVPMDVNDESNTWVIYDDLNKHKVNSTNANLLENNTHAYVMSYELISATEI